MALCARCGQQTEPDAEFCIACGPYPNDAWTIDSYSGAASRGIYSPTGRSAPPQHFRPRRWETPDPAAAERELQVSRGQTAWDADTLAPFAGHEPGAPATFTPPQTGMTPE